MVGRAAYNKYVLFFLNLQTVTGKDQKIQGKERTGDGMIWYLGTISVDEQDLWTVLVNAAAWLPLATQIGRACFLCHPWAGLSHVTVQPANATSGL